jgi:hypothetical protein
MSLHAHSVLKPSTPNKSGIKPLKVSALERMAAKKKRNVTFWDGEGGYFDYEFGKEYQWGPNGEEPSKLRVQKYGLICNSNGLIMQLDDHIRCGDIFKLFTNIAGIDPRIKSMVRGPQGSAFVNPSDIHVIYGGGYDVSMWLKGLKNETNITMENGRIVHGKTLYNYLFSNKTRDPVSFHLDGYLWEVKLRLRRQFTLRLVRPSDLTKAQAKTEGFISRKFELWDISSFYMGKFTTALAESGIEVEAAGGNAAMENMKGKRNDFRIPFPIEVVNYCVSECMAGKKLAELLFEGFRKLQVQLKRFDSPGAAAAALMDKMRVNDHKPPVPNDPIIKVPVRQRGGIVLHDATPSMCAFFGGRIECTRIGGVKNPILIDIASAYPSQMVKLPSMYGKWSHSNDGYSVRGKDEYRIVHIKYDFPIDIPFYPWPYRTQKGAVTFPPNGEVWIHHDEYEAGHEWIQSAKRWGYAIPDNAVEVLEYWQYTPDDASTRPFSFYEGLYTDRAHLKAIGDIMENAIKLALNSGYGKTAQHLGGTLDKLPPYLCMFWAGFITAGTRAQLLRAACLVKNPNSIFKFMTDGILLSEELEGLDMRSFVVKDPTGEPLLKKGVPLEKPVLGAWEVKRYEEAIVAQAGIYWTWEVKEPTKLDRRLNPSTPVEWHYKLRSRGFPPSGIDASDPDRRRTLQDPMTVVLAWLRGESKITIVGQRFVSILSGLMGTVDMKTGEPGKKEAKLYKWLCEWIPFAKVLDSSGYSRKRQCAARLPRIVEDSFMMNGHPMIDSMPLLAQCGLDFGLISAPYDKSLKLFFPENEDGERDVECQLTHDIECY